MEKIRLTKLGIKKIKKFLTNPDRQASMLFYIFGNNTKQTITKSQVFDSLSEQGLLVKEIEKIYKSLLKNRYIEEV